MSTSQILIILWRRGWITALTLIASVGVAMGLLFFIPGRYDAVATASIDPTTSAGDQILGVASGATAIALMQGNLIQLVQSERVALDVVRRLHLTANPAVQMQYRASNSFGREGVNEWMASSILKSVDPKFTINSNVLSIKYKSGDPNQAALIANAFLAATIDASIAMKAAQAEQTARWFAPQIEELRKELEAARSQLEAFQAQSNVALPTGNAPDAEGAALEAVTQELSSSKASLAVLKSRLASGATALSTDPSDPDLQLLNGLKEKLTTGETELESVKGTLGANNPKMLIAASSVASLRKQIADATAKLRDHHKDRIAQTEDQIRSLEAAQGAAQKELIAAQARRDQLAELQRDVAFRLEQLNERERAAEQAKLQSKLTFADIAVLDKAEPPIEPSFPKPFIVIPVAVGAGLTLGLILALLAEMLDRRVRSPLDLEAMTSAPTLGLIERHRRLRRLPSPGSTRIKAA
ncbi:MAG: hypothetical protein JO288_14465 [Hyphomicrobiales bacterium]|nr:hypothetical protein [Hyphomicrobiales bacterium]